MIRQIEKPHVLIGEGKDEENFFQALCDYCDINSVQVLGLGGKTKLRAFLLALVNTPGFTNIDSLGIARDADSDGAAAFQSVQDALRAANLPIPSRPLDVSGSNPRVSVMIIPGEDEIGALEDLCLSSVDGDVALPCVNQFFDCLKEEGVTQGLHAAKARVQAFLSSRRVSGLRLGEAACKGYWPFDHTTFDNAKNFLKTIA